MNDHVKNRYDFIYLFDVKDANPNGDPDAGNLPRIDSETGDGLITDVCLKRKIRNYVTIKQNNAPPYEIYFTEGAVLNQTHERAYKHIGEKPEPKKLPKDAAKAQELTTFMCENFYDIRTFGAVMTTEINCGQVRGPVQLSFARSINPIVTLEHAITRSSVTRVEDKEKERTMGRKYTVPYAIYRAYGFVNPFLAEKTFFKEQDLDLLWEALLNAFQFDQSAARPAGSMAARKLIIFKHEKTPGNVPSHKLFERIEVRRKTDPTEPAREFGDYEIIIDSSNLPQGVTLEEKI
jgi:CRISPR-associated protein Csd2